MCPGYTGSPLTCQLSLPAVPRNANQKLKEGGRYLIGVQSLNFACNTDNTPSLYTKLREFTEWITYTMENN